MNERRLRPRYIVRSGDTVWLVDETRPAAAYLTGDAPAVLVTWSDEGDPTDDGSAWPSRTVAADGSGIVVQDADRLTWVGPDGAVASAPAHELELAAADADGAWLVDQGTPAYEIPGLTDDENGDGDDDDEYGQETGRIVLARREGTSSSVETARPVGDLTVDGDSVVLRFNEQPVAHATPWGHSMEYPTSTLRAPRAGLFEHGPSGTPTRDPSPPRDDAGWSADEDMATDLRWAWLETDPDLVRRHGLPVGDLLWWAGADPDGDAIDRHAIVRGHHRSTAEVVVELDAGRGLVVAGEVVGGELWLAIARERFLAVPDSQGVEVVAVDGSGSLRTVLAPDAFDVSATDPPLVEPPSEADLRAHVDQALAAFQGFESFWTDQDGTTRPLADGLHDVSAAVEGRWPTMCVAVSLRHPSRPGLVLRRTYPLFDERGRPIHTEDADIGIMEDLDTGYLPPADEAVDGVLGF